MKLARRTLGISTLGVIVVIFLLLALGAGFYGGVLYYVLPVAFPVIVVVLLFDR